MTKIKKDYKIEDIIDLVKLYNSDNIDLINKSYDYTSKLLDKDKLQDALNVSYLLTTVQADSETISANILSYLLINDLVKRNTLEKDFDFNIIKLASNINKLKSISLSTENDYLIEYYKKVIVGMTEDVRVIIVALADRVYLMHGLDRSDDEANNKKIAKETLEIFAPLAHHLGVYKLKSELEDMSLRYLKPEVYYDIVEKLNGTKTERDNIINEMMMEVSNLLTEHNIIHEIKGRSKSIYSIYNKLDKGRKFSDIYDLLAIRILVKEESECYLVLGLIHSKFKPITKRFKDFIAMPKSNGYQSLHTTVFGINNELFEIQIRTYDMNEIAENGVAAHWSYKENKSAFNLSRTDAKLEFFKAVIDMNQSEANQDNIYNTIREENSFDLIYVFTPKGDVIELPKGSTPVDFAYRVHSKIGDSMIGALVNNQIVPLNYQLQDGDVVKINTSKSSPGPSEGWLSFVKLTQTKNKIKSFFAKSRREELISYGKEALEKELRKRKIGITEFLVSDHIKSILKQTKEKDLDTLYFEIGSNKYNARYIINLVYEEKEEVTSSPIITKNEFDINVSGISDVKVNIASCCLPIPGDNIVGYITKNNGITIHRDTCANVIHLEDRIVDVRFNEVTKNRYLTCIMVSLKNNQNRLGDILNKITGKNLIVDSVNTIYKDNIISYKISLYVMNLDSLTKLINDLGKLRYVKDVERL
jgi:GTP pyrophosphokinase